MYLYLYIYLKIQKNTRCNHGLQFIILLLLHIKNVS